MYFFCWVIFLYRVSSFDFTGWEGIYEFDVDNPSGIKYNEEVSLVINTKKLISGGYMRAFCQDIRFLDEGYDLLPYYLESGCDTNHTSFWVRVPQINVNPTPTPIYFVFGNSGAASTSLTFSHTFIVPKTTNESCSNAWGWSVNIDNPGYYLKAGSEGSYSTTGGYADHDHYYWTRTPSELTPIEGYDLDNGFGTTVCDSSHDHGSWYTNTNGLDVSFEPNTPSFAAFPFCETNSANYFVDGLVMFRQIAYLTLYSEIVERFSEIDTRFIRQGDFVEYGGSNSHKHSCNYNGPGTVDSTTAGTGGTSLPSPTHKHYQPSGWSVDTYNSDLSPPYVNTIFARVTEETPPLEGMIVISAGVPPMGWKNVTHLFDFRFPKAWPTFGGIGGRDFQGPLEHYHSVPDFESPPVYFVDTVSVLGGTDKPGPYPFLNHTHTIDVVYRLPEMPTDPRMDIPEFFEVEFIERQNSLTLTHVDSHGVCNGVVAWDSPICNDLGDCTIFKGCECDGYFSGINCESYSCYGIDKDSGSVCGGHGDCLPPGNNCNCTSGYKDPADQCRGFNCGVLDKDHPDVCSAHGSCTDIDTCQCDNSNYTGSLCDEWKCFGTWNYNSPCNGNGNCEDHDFCDCLPNYSETYCDVIWCYGFAHDDLDNVCSGYGVCSTANNCSCDSGFDGDWCQSWKCHSVDRWDTDVCSRHGKCLSVNNCSCDSVNYTGSKCEEWECFGTPKDDLENVCSGHGECLDSNVCKCEMFFSNLECDMFYCFGLQFDDPGVCGGNGTCISNNNCSCAENYDGNNCDQWSCGGKDRWDNDVCNRHGICEGPNKCKCDSPFYTGVTCGDWDCHGVHWNDSLACSENGECVDHNQCDCKAMYSEFDCSGFYCFGYLSNDTNLVCSGFGRCDSPNFCECISNDYSGDWCEKWKCNGLDRYHSDICNSRGICQAHDNCVCSSLNYTGSFCEWRCGTFWNNDTDACSSHGKCIDYETCLCDSGYSTDNCSNFECWGKHGDESCGGHGVCIGHNLCECQENYTSPTCEEWLCFGKLKSHPSVCSRRGTCDDVNTCSCFTNATTGDDCQIWSCFGLVNTDERSCSSHGDCFDSDSCDCDLYFSGAQCEEYSCWGVSALEIGNELCSNHGMCIDKDNCTCDVHYHGRNCEIYDCFDYSHTDPDVCSSHGSCVGINNCTCESVDYFGTDCGEWNCFDVSNLESDVCSNNGECLHPDYCECNQTHTGKDCSVYACFGLAHDHPNVCYRSGDCVAIDTCECTSRDTYGIECQEVISDARYKNKKTISVTWSVLTIFIDGLDQQFENCTLLIQNLNDFPSPPTCEFKKNVATTRSLEILFENNDVRRQTNIDYPKKLFVHPTSAPWETVELDVTGYPDEVALTMLKNILIPVLSVAIPILVICCVIAIVVITVLYCLYQKKKKFVKRVEQIEDLDILLEETEVQKDGTPKVKIREKFFKIPAGDLTLKKEIGHGGSGTVVYLAASKSMGKDVVAKVFPLNGANDDSLFTEFEKELNLCLSLAHPCILQTFGAICDPNRISIIMEYAPNGSIDSYLAMKLLSKEKIHMNIKLRWLTEICSGMNYLCEKEIIHRDLKPENVLLSQSLSAKICDFGLSRTFESGAMTKRIGTSPFMSPEITLGLKYDYKSDVFSLAIIMWIFLEDNLSPYGDAAPGIEFKTAKDEKHRPQIGAYDPKLKWYVDLMEKNWSMDTENRCSFSETLEILKQHCDENEVEAIDDERNVKRGDSASLEVEQLKTKVQELEKKLSRFNRKAPRVPRSKKRGGNDKKK